MTNANRTGVQPIDAFNGDFDLLPIAAHFRYGAVPVNVGGNEFQSIAVHVSNDLDIYAEAHWHLEAVRERRLNPTRSLNDAMRDINARVARRLYERSVA